MAENGERFAFGLMVMGKKYPRGWSELLVLRPATCLVPSQIKSLVRSEIEYYSSSVR